MKKRDFHKCLIAVAIIYVVRDISSQLLANQESSIFQVEGESQPLLEQQVNKKFNKQVRSELNWGGEILLLAELESVGVDVSVVPGRLLPSLLRPPLLPPLVRADRCQGGGAGLQQHLPPPTPLQHHRHHDQQ